MKGIFKNLTEEQATEELSKFTTLCDGIYQDLNGTWEYNLIPNTEEGKEPEIYVPGEPYDIYMNQLN